MHQTEIIYDRSSRKYHVYLDGELIGICRNYLEADMYLDFIDTVRVVQPGERMSTKLQDIISRLPQDRQERVKERVIKEIEEINNEQ